MSGAYTRRIEEIEMKMDTYFRIGERIDQQEILQLNIEIRRALKMAKKLYHFTDRCADLGKIVARELIAECQKQFSREHL